MKNIKRYILGGLMLGFMALWVSGCKDNFVSPASPTGTSIGSKVATHSNLTILNAALAKTNQLASLTNNNSGIFTLFAPTDSAFLVYFQTKLGKPAYTVDSVLLYINNMTTSTTVTISALNLILTYHIVSSNLPSSGLVGDGQVFSTLNGARLSVSKVGSNVILNANIAAVTSVNGAKIQTADEFAANGTIHTINRVLIPVSTASAAALLGISVSYSTNPATVTVSSSSTNFNIFANAVSITGLATTILPNSSPLPDFTIFAPADANFVTFLTNTYPSAGITNEATAIAFVKGLTKTSTPTVDDFATIIKKYIVPGRFVSTDFGGQSLTSLSTGYTIVVAADGTVSGISVVTKDQLTNAGVVHVISGVLP